MSDEDETYVEDMTFVDDNGVELKYTGEMKNNKKHGEGIEYSEGYDKKYDTDEWISDYEIDEINMLDAGKVYVYKGRFKNGKRDGHGKLTEYSLGGDPASWGFAIYTKTYEGNFVKGQKHGQGVLYDTVDCDSEPVLDNNGYCSGETRPVFDFIKYDAKWINGKMEGPCSMKEYNGGIPGHIYNGLMKNNKRHGIFISKTYYYNDEVLPKDDKRIKEIQVGVEKNKLAAVLDKKVTLGTKQDIGEILNSVGY